MTTPEQNGAVVPEAPLDSTQAAKAKEPEMPRLSAEEFRVFNRLAVMMDQYVRISYCFIRFVLQCDLSEADKNPNNKIVSSAMLLARPCIERLFLRTVASLLTTGTFLAQSFPVYVEHDLQDLHIWQPASGHVDPGLPLPGPASVSGTYGPPHN
jgi:hypothetical protein